MIKQRGFTLIEVLIALVVIAIALIAIVKVTSDDIKDTHYIRQKTYANWVALNAINEIRLNLVYPPVNNQTAQMANQWFFWSGTETATADPYVNKITVVVYNASKQPLLTLQGFKAERPT